MARVPQRIRTLFRRPKQPAPTITLRVQMDGHTMAREIIRALRRHGPAGLG